MVKRKPVLLPVKRLGWRKYARRYVTDPEKIEKGEKLNEQWGREIDLGWKDPVRWARVVWKSSKRSIPAEIKIQLSGTFTDAQADVSTWDRIEQHTGPLPREMEDEKSPGLFVVSINKSPTKVAVKYHYDLSDAVGVSPKHFFGSSLESRQVSLEDANWRTK